MKKGLLSILASALLVVGCQNYDDQFTNLESQISALASTVAGLSQVQSDLSSLAGTVGSLTSTVSGLGSTIDTAVADGLADIQADITAIEAAVADVASSEEVSDLSDAVAASQDDLDELLANSSVFTGDVTVNSPALLDAFLAMGSALNIVNGNVDITVSTAMDQTKVQTLVDNMLTIVKDLTYTSAASTIAETTFDNLTGVQSITITQGGGIRFPNLISATTIDMKDNFESTVDVIHFGSLTSVNAFETDGVAGVIEFNKATELHLTALPRYGAALTLKIDEGGTLLIPVLASVDANGLESTLDLTVEGASSLDFSLITDGDISAIDVATVTGGADHDGTITLEGVTKAVIPNFTRGLTITGTNDLEYLHVIGATPTVQTGATAVTTTPDLDVTGQTGLETVIIDGTLGDVTLSGNTKLNDITLTAISESVTVSGADDLVSLAIAGTTKSIAVTSNTDLESLVITAELNTAKGNAAAVATSGSLVVTGNTDLASLTSAFDPIKTLTITGNDDLAVLDFTGTEKVGATADKATVTIGDSSAKSNDLIAATITDSYAATETGIGAGSISDESGISTLKTYLSAAVSATTAGVKVYLDEITSYTIEQAAGTDATQYDDITHGGAQAARLAIVNYVPSVTTGAITGAAGKKAIEIAAGSALTIAHTHPTTLIGTAITGGAITLNSNPSLAVNQILDATNGYVANAAAVGVTLNAYVGGSPSIDVVILADNSSATNESANANSGAASATTLAATDVVGLTVGSLTATAVVGSTATTTAALASLIANTWNAKYAATNTYTAFSADATATAGTITISAAQTAGSRFDSAGSIAIVVTTGTDTTTNPVMGYKIGGLKASSDNTAVSTTVIVTAESTTAGVEVDTTQSGGIVFTGGTALSVTGTYTAAPTTSIMVAEAFSDVTLPLDSDAGSSTTAATTNYLAWVE
ncbi:hypothetical protein PQZ08_01915 [Flavobacteriaceae bacterium]|nr:hypothetical protein [Flavobacteriaceae bacterium]